MSPRFFNQNIAAKEPEKNMPSTAAKATSRSAKLDLLSEIQRRAQSAFFLMQGTRTRQYVDYKMHVTTYCCQWR